MDMNALQADFTIHASRRGNREASRPLLTYVVASLTVGLTPVTPFLPPGELLRIQAGPQMSGSLQTAKKAVVSAPVMSMPAKLDLLREVFGVSTSALAQILQVSRPTIYQWAQDPGRAIASESRQRLDQIVGFAETWNRSLRGRPMDHWLTDNEAGKPSLLDLFRAGTLDSKTIRNALSALISHANEAQRKIDQARGAAELSEIPATAGLIPTEIQSWSQTRQSVIRSSQPRR